MRSREPGKRGKWRPKFIFEKLAILEKIMTDSFKHAKSILPILFCLFCSLNSLDAKASGKEIDSVLQSLKDRDYFRWQSALSELRNRKDAEQLIPELSKLLTGAEQAYAYRASEALAAIGKESIPALKQALNMVPNREGIIIQTFGVIGEDALPELTALVDDPLRNLDTSGLALNAIGNIDMPAGRKIPLLERYLSDPSETVQNGAIAAIAKSGPAAKDVLPKLLRFLESPSVSSRCVAASAIAGIVDKSSARVVPQLIKALADKDIEVRVSIVRALGNIGAVSDDIVPALILLIADEQEGAPSAIEPHSNTLNDVWSVVPALSERRNNTNRPVKSAVIAALGRIGSPAIKAIPNLVAALNEDDALATQAIEAIVNIGPSSPSELSGLVDGLLSSVHRMRASCVEVLRRLGPKVSVAMGKELGSSSGERKIVILEALGYMGPGAKDSLPALISCLQDKSIAVRQKALAALGYMGPEAASAIPEITQLLNGKSDGTIERAREALDRIGPAKIPEYVEIGADRQLETALEKQYDKAEEMLYHNTSFYVVAGEFRKVMWMRPEVFGRHESFGGCSLCDEDYPYGAKEALARIDAFMKWTGSPTGEPLLISTIKYMDKQYMDSREFYEVLALRREWASANQGWLVSTGGVNWNRYMSTSADRSPRQHPK